MSNIHLVSVCGIYCGDCKYLNEMCKGCGTEKGKIFWTKSDEIPFDICPLWECCIEKKQLEHCGLCSEFPCKTYLDLKDPEDPKADLNKQKNVENLSLRIKIGTDKWLEEKENYK